MMFNIENGHELSKEERNILKLAALRSLCKGEITGLINIPLYAIVLTVTKLHISHFNAGLAFGAAFIVLCLADSSLCYLIIKKENISLKAKYLLYPIALLVGLSWSILFLYTVQHFGLEWEAVFILLILIGNVMMSIVVLESDFIFNTIYAICVLSSPIFATSYIENTSGHEWKFIALATCFSIVAPFIIYRNYKNYWENAIKAHLLDKKNKKLIDVQKQLSDSARKAGRAEVASSILHNVGNLMNSVNVATQMIHEDCQQIMEDKMDRVIDLFKEDQNELGHFFNTHEKACDILSYMEELQKIRKQKSNSINDNIDSVLKHVEQIKKVIDFQQMNLSDSKMFNNFNIEALIDNTLKLFSDEIKKHKIKVTLDYQDNLPTIFTDKTKLTQILINLISNAIDALKETLTSKSITIKVRTDEQYLIINVTDNGAGIEAENLVKIFSFGFTMKSYGHGFGLHSSSLFALELGGDLTAQSNGLNQGATFILRITY